MKKLFLFLFILFTFFLAKAQYFNSGQDPASVRWRQINTDKFKLIYPEFFEAQAQRFMNVMDTVKGKVQFPSGPPMPKIPIIFHTQTIEPNAFATWTPRRSEFFTCPPQDSYAQDWLEQLSIHEYRHMVQMAQVNQGFTRFMYYLVGEHAVGAFTGLFEPLWFMEGDAVCVETALSRSGRGRVPAFEQGIRTQILEKGSYSFDKAIFGSYKDFVPDHYVVGYQITANTKRKYGDEVWQKAVDEVGRKPFIITPFNHGLKKAAGKGKTALYEETVTDLTALWTNQKEKTELTELKPVSLPQKTYTLYQYPQVVNDTLFLAERSSLDDIPRFVFLDIRGNERVFFTPGFFSTDVFSTNLGNQTQTNKPGQLVIDRLALEKGKIVWAEKKLDPRWQQRSYSVLKIVDFETREVRQLTKRTRLFAPSFKPDGKQIVAVQVSEQNESSLQLFDAQTGRYLSTCFTAKTPDFIMTPNWSKDGKQLVFTLLSKNGKSLCLLNLESRSVETVLPPTFVEISNPSFVNERYLIFNGAFSGIDNIYAIDLTTKNVFQVTSSMYGASNADYNSRTRQLVYSDYTANGLRVVTCPFDTALWKPLPQVEDHSAALYKSLAANENYWVFDSSRQGTKVYESKPYRKFPHLFHFHSWAPAYLNYMDETYDFGLSVMSQNLLSTSTLVAGYHWISNEKTGQFKATWEYAGWYPVLNLDASYGKRAAYDYFTDGSSKRYTWDETQLDAEVKVPLLFTFGKYYINLVPSATLSWVNRENNHSLNPEKFEGSYSSLNYRMYAARYIKQSLKDIYPRWGQVIDLNYAHAPFGEIDFGHIVSAEATLFFPGFIRTHGIKLYGGIQNTTSGPDSYFSSIVDFPRGIAPVQTGELLSLKANYKFPVWYPDGGIAGIAYFKRVKANLFYDFSQTDLPEAMQSYGVELTTDAHFARFTLPIDIGVRLGMANYPKQTFFADFLFSMNLGLY